VAIQYKRKNPLPSAKYSPLAEGELFFSYALLLFLPRRALKE